MEKGIKKTYKNIAITKMAYKFLGLTLLTILSVFAFTSCNKVSSTTNKDEVAVENNTSENKQTSKLLQDSEFLNKFHIIRNPKTNSSIVVNGEGKVLLSTIDPITEQVGVVEDIDKNKSNYLFKVYYGESIKKVKSDDGVGEYSELTLRCVFYDKNGKEVGFTTNNYGALYTTKDKIIYRDNSVNYGEKDIRVFDTNTKETTTLQYANITAYNGNFLMSTDSYGDDKADKEEIIICDESFNELKKIEGYSYNSTYGKENAIIIIVSRMIKDTNNEEGVSKKYNYLDENYNFIFDEDVDETIYEGDQSILTVRKGDKVFDYDLVKKERIGEERPYEVKKTSWEISEEKHSQYYGNVEKILGDDSTYVQANIFCHDDDVLYFARKTFEPKSDDEITFDVYDANLNKVMELNSIDGEYENEGYFFANKDTVYNSKLEVVKKFDSKCLVNRFDKFDKVFFTNNNNVDYSSKKDFELYDAKFNLLYDHLESVDSYPYKEYVVVATKENTLFLDKDLKVANEIAGRSFEISNWGDFANAYKEFKDLKTNRCGIIDGNYKIIVDNLKYIENLNKKYFTYQNGFKYGIMDYEGIPVFTYSIFDTMKEDASTQDFDGKFVEEFNDNY